MLHHVVLGRFDHLKSEEVIARLDVCSGNSDGGTSWFEVNFGTSYVEAGWFEVYGRDDYNLKDVNLLKKLFPFSLPDQTLPFLTAGNPECVFFYSDSRHPLKTEINGIYLIRPIKIDQLSYE